jgi:hypothetical protein
LSVIHAESREILKIFCFSEYIFSYSFDIERKSDIILLCFNIKLVIVYRANQLKNAYKSYILNAVFNLIDHIFSEYSNKPQYYYS